MSQTAELTPIEFINLLKRRCKEKVVGEARFFEREAGSDEAYKDIIGFINCYEKGEYRNG